MDPWARRRQTIVLGTVAFIALGIAVGAYFLYRPALSCSDGIQNQGELGRDCGGPCAPVCQGEARPLVVEWVRVFPVSSGLYDVVARVSNPNEAIGTPSFSYTFELFDSENLSITRKVGTTFVNPNESFYIFESLISVGARIPARAVLTIDTTHAWSRYTDTVPKLSIVNKQYVDDPAPLATATLINNTLKTLTNIRALVVLFNEEGIAYGASATVVKNLIKDAQEPLSFTWPSSFGTDPARVDMQSRVSVWDGTL